MFEVLFWPLFAFIGEVGEDGGCMSDSNPAVSCHICIFKMRLCFHNLYIDCYTANMSIPCRGIAPLWLFLSFLPFPIKFVSFYWILFFPPYHCVLLDYINNI